MSTPDPHDLMRTALDAADAAAAIHREHAGRANVETASEKSASDFVSEVDLEAQRAALAIIVERYPEHRILAEEERDEEGGEDEGAHTFAEGAPTWIVDPLDGTTNYLHGHPMHCASVGVVVESRPIAGAVVASATGERWSAARGRGAWKNGQPIRVSDPGTFRKALIGTGFPFKELDLLPEYLRQFDRVLRGTSGIRRGGSAALDLCYLASGVFDGFWELHLSPWDIAAGIVILREAGGMATRLDGREIDFAGTGSVLAANSEVTMGLLGRMVRGEAESGRE